MRAWLLASLLFASALVSAAPAEAAPAWQAVAVASPASVPAGSSTTITVTAKSNATRRARVLLEVLNPAGARVHSRLWTNVYFVGMQDEILTDTWLVPSTLPPGTQTMRVAIFSPDGTNLRYLNDHAGTLTVT